MRMLTPIRWYLAVVAIAFPVLAAAHLLRDRPLDYALREAALWSAITAAVYVASRLYNARRGQHCALCVEAPPASPGQGD